MTDTLWTAPIRCGSGKDNITGARDGQCSVELLGLQIYGDFRYGYELPCLDQTAQAVVVQGNDAMSEEMRNSRPWRLLVASLVDHPALADPIPTLRAWVHLIIERFGTPKEQEAIKPHDIVMEYIWCCWVNDITRRYYNGDNSITREELLEALRIKNLLRAKNRNSEEVLTSIVGRFRFYQFQGQDDDQIYEACQELLELRRKALADTGNLLADREEELVTFVETLNWEEAT